MTLLFYAQPYDISAEGFFFRSPEEYRRQAADTKNSYGDAVEEFEIQFIDGERIDAECAAAFQLSQANFVQFFDLIEEWNDDQKLRFIIANGKCGYNFNPNSDDIDSIDLDVYEVGSLKELAEQFVDEGLFGDVPKAFENYIDFEAIARDLGVEFATTDIAGKSYAYRCA